LVSHHAVASCSISVSPLKNRDGRGKSGKKGEDDLGEMHCEGLEIEVEFKFGTKGFRRLYLEYCEKI
jgi:hypothetical protein